MFGFSEADRPRVVARFAVVVGGFAVLDSSVYLHVRRQVPQPHTVVPEQVREKPDTPLCRTDCMGERNVDEKKVETAEITQADGERSRLFDDPTTVRLSLGEGEAVPPHRHPDKTVVFYVVSGRFDVRLDGDSHEIAEDEALRFEGTKEVSPVAVTDSEALVFLA